MKKLNIIAKGENPSELLEYVENELSDKELRWYKRTIEQGGNIWLVKRNGKILDSIDVEKNVKKPKSYVMKVFEGVLWGEGTKTPPREYKIEVADKNFNNIIFDLEGRLKK